MGADRIAECVELGYGYIRLMTILREEIMEKYIPLSIPNISGNEWKYVKECLDTGWVSSAGPFVNKFEDDFKNYVGAKYAIACSSGTAALHISLHLAGVKPGDLVLAPSLTFIASINAIHYVGAEPYFFDSDEYYNLDSKQLITFLNEEVDWNHSPPLHRSSGKRIGALLAVHVFGNAANISELSEFCKSKNIPLIEDAAESLGTRYYSSAPENVQDKHTGTIGQIGCFSFNGNKILTTGGGGMIVTNDPNLAKKAKYLTTQSKDDETYFIHNEVGYNYRMTNIQAALGVAQLEKMPELLSKKQKIYQKYKDELGNLEGLKLAPLPPYASNNCWLTCIQIDSQKFGVSRDDLMSHLRSKKIEARPVWYLNHLQKPYERCQRSFIKKAAFLWETTVSIPCSTSLSDEDQTTVIESIKALKK